MKKTTQPKLKLANESIRNLEIGDYRRVGGAKPMESSTCSELWSCQAGCTITELASGCTVGSYGC